MGRSRSLFSPLSLIGLKSDFEATVFTNLSPEHLDFHEDMEAYQAKRRLFDFECPVAVVAVSDAGGKRLASELRGIGHEA